MWLIIVMNLYTKIMYNIEWGDANFGLLMPDLNMWEILMQECIYNCYYF